MAQQDQIAPIKSGDASAAPVPGSTGLRRALMRGGAILGVRQAASMCLSLLSVFLIMRILGPAEYGTFVAAYGIHFFASNFGEMGVEAYLVRGGKEMTPRDFDIASTFLVCAGFAIALVESLVLPRFGSMIGLGRAMSLLPLLATSLPLQLAAVPATARLVRDLDFKRLAIVQLTTQLLYCALAVSLALSGWGAWALALGWVSQQVAACVLVHRLVRWVPRPAWDLATLKDMVSYAFSYSSANWIMQARSLVNPLIVGGFLGVEAVGTVNLAVRIVESVSFVKNVAWQLSLAGFARMKDDTSRMALAIGEGAELQIFAVGLPLLLFASVGQELIPALLGPRWLPAFHVYPYVALAYATSSLYGLHAAALQMLRRNWDVTAFTAAHLLVFAGAAYLLVRPLGIMGYGAAETAALLPYGILAYRVRRAVGTVPDGHALIWHAALAIALLMRPLGLWSCALPLLLLLSPKMCTHVVDRARLAAQLLLGGGTAIPNNARSRR